MERAGRVSGDPVSGAKKGHDPEERTFTCGTGAGGTGGNLPYVGS